MFGRKKEKRELKGNFTVIVEGTCVHGDIYSEPGLIIEGGIRGDVYATQVLVKPKGWVQGNLTCRELVIEPGGVVDGELKVAEDKELEMLKTKGTLKPALPEPPENN